MSRSRAYNARWKKARSSYLLANPLCVMCARHGLVTAATVVDHVRPHKGDSELFWDRSNWQPLCAPCHDRHKQRIERGGCEVGCDVRGRPLDAQHHWNAQGRGGQKSSPPRGSNGVASFSAGAGNWGGGIGDGEGS